MKHKKRVLIKISWEALQWERTHWIEPKFLKELSLELKEILDNDIWLVLVLGWGNIFRGMAAAENGMDRTPADYMGMLATIMNWIAMQDALESVWVETRLLTALDIPEVWEKYIIRRGMRHIEKGRIVITVGWTGNPFFTTDTSWVLRALELECDLMIKATKVDWIYNKDPHKFDDAKLIKNTTYSKVINEDIRVMDHTAITLAKEGNLEMKVVNLYKKWAMLRACMGEKEGTTIQCSD